MMLAASSGHDSKKGLRIDLDDELMMYAAMNTTIAIFHRGGATTLFESGKVNHVSMPVAE
jgi:hypothetical protein